MNKRIRAAVLTTLLFGAAAWPAQSQLIYEFTPSFGWRTGGGFDFTPDLSNQKVRFGFADEPSYGMRAAVGFTNSFFLEFEWDRQPSSLNREGTVADTAATLGVNIDYYHAGLLFQHAYDRLQPMFLFSLGITTFYPENDLEARTRFSFGAGGGAKYFLTHNFGLRGQARFYISAMGSDEDGYWCDFYGCWSTIDVNWLTQWSFSGGVFVRFGGPKRRRY